MELASVMFWQVATLFLLIFAGVLCIRAGILPQEAKGLLSRLLLSLVLPAMVLGSYMSEYDPEVARNLIQTFLYSTLAILLGLGVALAAFRGKDPCYPLCRFACVFSNAAYMGFPVILALFGDEGLIYAGAYVTVFNLLLWTLGIGLVGPRHGLRGALRSILRTPVIYAVMVGIGLYSLQIPIPPAVRAAVGQLGAMTTPLSMIITGMLIAESDLIRLLRDGRLWGAIGVRLILIPALCVPLFLALGLRGLAAQVVLLLEACPCAAMTSVVAVQYHHREDFAGGLVAVSTLFSIATLPLCALLLTMYNISG